MRVATAAAVIALLLVPAANAETKWVTPGWAGYVVRSVGGSFGEATGGWTQPRVVCNRPRSSVAVWLGLGGTTSSSRALEQVGTSADCSDRGLVSYTAWYELFPAPPVELPLPIAPGDKLHAAITVAGWAVTVTFSNDTSGSTFSTETWMRAPETDSAEWIVEAPAVCFLSCTPLPLADFAKVTFTNAETRVEAHRGAIDDGAWAHLRLEMAPHRLRTVAAPTRLFGSGSSFSVVRRPPSPPG